MPSLDHMTQHGHRISGEPVVTVDHGLDQKIFAFRDQESDAALPAVGGGSASIPTVRLAKRPIFDGRAAPLSKLFERPVCQDQVTLGSRNDLHAHQHGDSQWKGLSEIAATSREHFPEKFGGLA
jgi:hypothetical protein